MQRFRHGDVELAFLDEGQGDPVVLVHGFASNAVVNWVNPSWVTTLTRAGRRVIALDNRGHGQSSKLYDPAAYHTSLMAEDVRALLDHLAIARADVMGYSMGARITAYLALAHPSRLRSATFGGLGINLVEGQALPPSVADAMEAPSLADVQDPFGRTFRAFAEQTKSDRKALAACIRGSRQMLSREEVGDDPRTGADCGRNQGLRRRLGARTGGAYPGRAGARYSGPRSHARGRRQGVQAGIPGFSRGRGRELTPPSGGEWHYPYRLNRRSVCAKIWANGRTEFARRRRWRNIK